MTAAPVFRFEAIPGELRLAATRKGRLVAFELVRPSRPDPVGSIHLARVAAFVEGGAFLALDGNGSAFLPDDEAAPARPDAAPIRPARDVLVEGQALPVRLIRAPLGGKDARASARGVEALAAPLALPPRLVRAAPTPPERWIAAADPAPSEVLTDDADLASRLAARFLGVPIRFHPGPAPLFPPALAEAIEALEEPEAALGDGARLLLTPTPALLAVDVDAGSLGPTEANRRAAAELPRQLALRGIGGAVVIDFAGGRGAAERRRIEHVLTGALAAHLPQAIAFGFTRGGLFELGLPRLRPALHELRGTPPDALSLGLDALRRLLAEARSRPGRPPRLVASPAVAQALAGEPGVLEGAARVLGAPLALRIDEGLSGARVVAEDGPP